MVVYAEAIIIDNFLVDGVLLYASVRAANAPNAAWRIALAAALGSGCAVLGAVFGGWVLLTLRILVAPVMVLIALKRCSAKKMLLTLLVFLGLTACFGGAFYFLLSMLGIRKAVKIPIGFIALGAAVLATLSTKIILKLKGVSQKKQYIYTVEINHRGKTARLQGYLDSGNLLHDPLSGQPIIVFDAAALTQIFGSEIEADILLGRPPRDEKWRMIDYRTVSGKGKIPIFTPEEVIISSKKTASRLSNVMAGITNLEPICECRALFGPNVLAEASV